jgi:hypothetical protein
MISKYLSKLILISFAMFCGCRSLPDAKLGDCEKLDYDTFAKNFQFDIPDPLRYRYTLRWRGRALIANGITQKASEGRVNIAGFSNTGITLYSAQWQDGDFEILKNNTKMPDRFLKRSILNDALLLYRQFPAEGDCIRRDVLDGSLWLKTDRELAGGTGYFVVLDERPAWGGIRNEKVCFKAMLAQKNNNAPAQITIENFYEGYRAEIRILNESPVE